MNIGEDVYAENVNTLPKNKDTENINYTSSHSDIIAGTEFSTVDKVYKGNWISLKTCSYYSMMNHCFCFFGFFFVV